MLLIVYHFSTFLVLRFFVHVRRLRGMDLEFLGRKVVGVSQLEAGKR